MRPDGNFMMDNFQPGYIKLFRSGELAKRALEAQAHLSICDVCALNCPIDRRAGKFGACRTGVKAKVSSYGPHHGEEAPLSGWNGSGTIFFSRCNLKCQYCQNYEISQMDSGDETSPEDLAHIMLTLQSQGCHNINLVSPSHIVPQILAGLLLAAERGLNIPLVYNTGGYDSLSMLSLLDRVVDIYMPDMKYGASDIARKYSRIPNYVKVNQAAVREMHRQVGDLQFDQHGMAVRGLLVRHLVLPNNLAGTENITQFLANEISKNTYLNIMSQYHPCYKASQFPELNRRITSTEYQLAVETAMNSGLYRFDSYRD